MSISKFGGGVIALVSAVTLGLSAPARAAITVETYQFLGTGYGTMTLNHDTDTDLYTVGTLDLLLTLTGDHYNLFNADMVGSGTQYILYGSVQGLNLAAFQTDFRIDFDPHLSTQSAQLSYTQSGLPNTNFALISISQVPAAVPEPAAWSMMLLGFGGIGFAMRKRPRLRLAAA